MSVSNAATETIAPPSWQVLIVDDDKSVHQTTRFALDDFIFEGRSLDLISAYSTDEARNVLKENPLVAAVLLDVVMESETAGLDFVRWVRGELNNQRIRIVLRTGQPGYAPELEVVRNFDINDYREKSQLTVDKLTATLLTALRSFRDIVKLEEQSGKLHDALMLAEKANQAKTNFIAHVSHEFRTPLNGIIGLSEMIGLEALGPVGNQKYKEYAWDIVTSGRQLQGMVERVLRFSESGGSRPIINEPFDLRAVIAELSGSGRAQDRSKDENDAEPLRPVKKGKSGKRQEDRGSLMLHADREAVRTMLSNLITNAVQHNPKGCKVRVTARPNAENGLILAVKDDGTGIGEDVLEQLNDPLAVPDDPYVAGRGGLGLGLVITKSLIEGHGGSLAIDSSPETGTNAQLIFPAGSLSKQP